MPVDKFRYQGPDDSEDYHLHIPIITVNCENGIKKLVSDSGKRRDTREWDELRKIYMKTGIVSSIKGSCYVEVGHTKVLVSVNEPREIPRLAEFCANGELEVEFRFAPFSEKSRRSPLIQSDEKDLSLMLKRALEPVVCRNEFPNCQVDIYVMVLDNDGSCLAAAVTAAGVALADAGIPMFDTVAAISLGINGSQYFFDPTYAEEQFCNSMYVKESCEMGQITLAYLPTIGQISSFTSLGCLTSESLTKHLDLLVGKCCQIATLCQLRLAKDVLKKCELAADEADEDSALVS